MFRKNSRKLSGNKRRALCDKEAFHAKQRRAQEEYAAIPKEPLVGGGMITGPLSIVDLMRSHGEAMTKE
jgi:hypothetical protein